MRRDDEPEADIAFEVHAGPATSFSEVTSLARLLSEQTDYVVSERPDSGRVYLHPPSDENGA